MANRSSWFRSEIVGLLFPPPDWVWLGLLTVRPLHRQQSAATPKSP
jgi:hypothetical protein